ncbi:MAG: ribonuclease P protein component [Vampirovibrionales bacterium]
MLPKQYRLTQSWLINKTMQQGVRLFRSPCLTLVVLFHWHTCPLPLPLPARLPRQGWMVSKKVHKRANQRNRVKRIIREHVRQAHLAQWQQVLASADTSTPVNTSVNALGGVATLLWWAHAGLTEKTNAELRTLADTALERLLKSINKEANKETRYHA